MHHLNSPLITSPYALFGIGVNFNIKDAQCCVVGDVHCTESGHLPTQISSDLLSSDMSLPQQTKMTALLSLVRVVGAQIRLTMPTNLYSLYPPHSSLITTNITFILHTRIRMKTGSFRSVRAAAVSGTARQRAGLLVPGPSLLSSCGVFPAATVLWPLWSSVCWLDV